MTFAYSLFILHNKKPASAIHADFEEIISVVASSIAVKVKPMKGPSQFFLRYASSSGSNDLYVFP